MSSSDTQAKYLRQMGELGAIVVNDSIESNFYNKLAGSVETEQLMALAAVLIETGRILHNLRSTEKSLRFQLAKHERNIQRIDINWENLGRQAKK
ncbi:hypothetical protein SS50377_25068 [Spironucleus salmonicida]|uniref:Uncharacterized protein n=1 Tax=Spironucleus salmonicida TaxID=348837 RepID=V6LHC1_9EUKA|nr:hypothetical protein SS50377_25068 [Spironucleus salmonicida]|eukprot:EST43116.1 Hypothetical protein SS50377_17274 [Spironucleus salmonicida]